MKLSKIAELMNADTKRLDRRLFDAEVSGFAIDSRAVKDGDVFFALSQPDYRNNCFNGDFADSHEFIGDALGKGAKAVVARPDKLSALPELEKFADKMLLVDDAILALQNLAGGIYREKNIPVVAVTGSAGKTTAKTLIAHVLSSKFKVLTNIKNYNNGLGHPLTVLRLETDGKDYDVAVLEMGMSTPNNEIARLCRITPPNVAVELNVLPVHIEHLGSIENIAKAKAELVEGMKDGGTAVLNADDARVWQMRELSKGKVIGYGFSENAEVTARNISFVRFGETKFTLVTPSGESEVTFHLDGKHNIMNGLSAAAVGFQFGLTPQEIADALKTAEPPAQRGEILYFENGITVINDSYNSNPDALLSMAATVCDGGANASRRIIVAGEMRELGADSAKIHRETGVKIAQFSKIDKLVGVEGFAEDLIEGARENGLADVDFYKDSETAAAEFIGDVKNGDLILVKGSRGVKTEKVIDKLLRTLRLEGR